MQTVIVSKDHPEVETFEDAVAVARDYADRIYTSRETSTSFRFRQRPPSCFVKGTFWQESPEPGVFLTYGILRPGMTKKASCKPRRKRR